MSLLAESLTFGLAVAFMVLGIFGIVVPLIPGILLIWLSVLAYAIATGFEMVTAPAFVFITIIALVVGTADLWMSAFGARKGGARRRSLVLGAVGAIIGTFVLPLLGTIIGYAAGILFSEYLVQSDLRLALKASLGGVAGWGVATAIQLGGGLLILVIFLLLVLA